jgi:uncharacterized RmlC-like cupin family protein
MRSRRRVYGPATLLIMLAAVGAFSTLQAQQSQDSATTRTQTTTVTSTTTQQATAAQPGAGQSVAKAEEHDRPLVLKQADVGLSWGDCPPLFPPGCKIAVLHGDPAKPGADVFFRVPGGYTIPAHWHTSAERMVLVSGSLEVTYAGHPSVRLETNDYAYGPAKLPHNAKCRSTTPCTLFIAFDDAVDAHPFEGHLGGKT